TCELPRLGLVLDAMRAWVPAFAALLILPACFGGPPSSSRGDTSDDDHTETTDTSAAPSDSAQHAAPPREGGTLPPVDYGPGVNVASIEDRGANCALPALPGFDDLEEQARLPDPFLSLDGTRIVEKDEWTCRRAEILAQVQAYEFGPKPSKPDQVHG